jgi:hypothetical protein
MRAVRASKALYLQVLVLVLAAPGGIAYSLSPKLAMSMSSTPPSAEGKNVGLLPSTANDQAWQSLAASPRAGS